MMLMTVLLAFSSPAQSASLNLAGQWRFELDRADAGISGRWFDRALPDKIELPGSLPAQGIGDDITTNTVWTGGIVDHSWFTAPIYEKYREPGNVKIPFWLQPEKYYAGAAWFQRDIEIPKSWGGQRVVLSLERPHWETRVWLDGNFIGSRDSLSAPHEYDFGRLAPGKHTLAIRVDNRRIVDIGENSHAISDHTQGNWNGIVGRIELRATPLVWLDDLQVYPNVTNKSVTVKGTLKNDSGQAGGGELTLQIQPGNFSNHHKIVAQKNLAISWDTNGGSFETGLSLGADARCWDEFRPNLYRLTAAVDNGGEKQTTFGLRQISTDGTQFTINGRKTFIRGTLECCIFPKTGHPPTDVAAWKRVIRIAQSHGLNLLRLHSYCPPEAAFAAADELGMYLQVETCWANQSTTLGDEKPVDRWVYRETDRIIENFGNHPSFILMPYGNEPGGKNHGAYLSKFIAHYRALDSRRLWTSASGWPELPENQFDVTPEPRIQAWGAGLSSRINAQPPATTNDYRDYIARRSVPVVSHEIGEWCVYPDFAEISEYTGYLKPKNFEIFRASLNESGMASLAHPFLLASGKLQTLCYKEDIESALRTPGMGGFELLDLHDFPGQGTALVGVLNPFWESKGYVTAAEYRRFCNATVPLARLAKRVFTTDETLTAQLEVAHFGSEPLKAVKAQWKLTAQDGAVFARGEFPAQDIAIGNGISLGAINVNLHGAKTPAKYQLAVRLAGTPFVNDWDVWIYPATVPAPPADVLVTNEWNNGVWQRLRDGGKVLLTVPGHGVRNYDSDPVKLGFSSIFWNTVWTGRQAPTTLGILCDPENPALAKFPTDYFSNWQWWYLIQRAGALRLDLLPHNLKPIVRVIDDWTTAHPLALIIEGRVGAGKLMVCGFDLTRGADDPVSRQMRAGLLDYMVSPHFAPKVEISPEQIGALVIGP